MKDAEVERVLSDLADAVRDLHSALLRLHPVLPDGKVHPVLPPEQAMDQDERGYVFDMHNASEHMRDARDRIDRARAAR